MGQDLNSVAVSGRSHYVELTAGTIHYRRWASDRAAPSVVLLHGNGDNWKTWVRVAPALHATDLDVFAVDLRGNGASVRPPAGRYGLPELAVDLHDFVAALDIHRPVLVGHCWGAAIALTLASGAFGDGVSPVLSGLVLEELPADMAAPENQPVVRDFLSMVRRPRGYVRSWIDLACRDWHPLDRESLLDSARTTDLDVYLSAINDGANAGPLLPLLARLKVPVLVLRGNPKRGGILSNEEWRQLLRYLPDHSVARHLAENGHDIHRGGHAEYMRLVTEFIRTVVRCDGRDPRPEAQA